MVSCTALPETPEPEMMPRPGARREIILLPVRLPGRLAMGIQKQKIDPGEILCYNSGLLEAGRFFVCGEEKTGGMGNGKPRGTA